MHKFQTNEDLRPITDESYKSLPTAGETRMLGGEVAYLRSHRNSTKGFAFAGASDASQIIIREEYKSSMTNTK